METIEVRRDDGVVTITLNRPERMNAINGTMFSELKETLTDVAHDQGDRAILITGAGKAFCSGYDLAGDGEKVDYVTMLRSINEVAVQLHGLPKPTVAAVNGTAAGAGLSVAIGCDLVVASAEARFSAIFIRRALGIDVGASWLLPRLIGLQAAKRMSMLGDWVDATEAEHLGLVSEVVAHEQLVPVAGALARRLADGPSLALSMVKVELNESLGRSFQASLEQEAWAQAVLMKSPDVVEAFAAFRQKREPNFRTN